MQGAIGFQATLLLCYIWLFPRYIILEVISSAKWIELNDIITKRKKKKKKKRKKRKDK
jgi:DNA-binding helix-hairpin-helix protein with protein kinase domain